MKSKALVAVELGTPQCRIAIGGPHDNPRTSLSDVGALAGDALAPEFARIADHVLATLDELPGLVVTWPVGRDEAQQPLLREAAIQAGFAHVDFVPGPIAAARRLEGHIGRFEPEESAAIIKVHDDGIDFSVVQASPDGQLSVLAAERIEADDDDLANTLLAAIETRPLWNNALSLTCLYGDSSRTEAVAAALREHADGDPFLPGEPEFTEVEGALAAAELQAASDDTGRVLPGPAARPRRTLASIAKPLRRRRFEILTGLIVLAVSLPGFWFLPYDGAGARNDGQLVRLEDGTSEGAVDDLPSTGEPTEVDERPLDALTPIGALIAYPEADDISASDLTVHEGIGYFHFLSNADDQERFAHYGAIDMATGELLWRRDHGIGEAFTPDVNLAVSGSLLVISMDFPDSLTLLQASSGETITTAPVGDRADDVMVSVDDWKVISEQLVWVDPSDPRTVLVYNASGEVAQRFSFERNVAHYGTAADCGVFLGRSAEEAIDCAWVATDDGQVAIFDLASAESAPLAGLDPLEIERTSLMVWNGRTLAFTEGDGWSNGFELNMYGPGGQWVGGDVSEHIDSPEFRACGEFLICINSWVQGRYMSIFDLRTGHFVHHFDAQNGDVRYGVAMGDEILVGIYEDGVGPRTTVLDFEFEEIDTLDGYFFALDRSTALSVPPVPWIFEPSSAPIAGYSVAMGEPTVLNEELVVGGQCSFDTETLLCFLMDGVQAYRFRA